MITLYGAGPQLGLPEHSPFVTKTDVQLKMADLAYRKQRSAPQASPKGQLPFIDDDGEVVADSTFIRAHIERKYGVDLDACLDARERAQAWAIERHAAGTMGQHRTCTWKAPSAIGTLAEPMNALLPDKLASSLMERCQCAPLTPSRATSARCCCT